MESAATTEPGLTGSDPVAGYLRRGVQWRPVLAAAALAMPLLVLSAPLPGTAFGDHTLQLGLALLGVAIGFSQDEPAAAVVDATPTPWRTRAGLRLLVLGPMVAVWAVAATVAGHRSGGPPTGLLLAEGGGVLLTAAAAALVLRRAGRATAGETLAGPVLLGVVVVGALEVPPGWIGPTPEWRSGIALLALLLPVAAIVGGMALREPRRRATRLCCA